MTNEIKNVPELRFPEFKEEWVEKKLGEITSKISDGIHSTPTYDSNGDIYFINGNNLVNGRIDFKTSKKISVQEFNKYKNYLEAKNTLLLSINGTIGNIAKYEGENILLGKSAAYINVVSKFISRCYIFYYLQTSKIYESFLRELTGTTIKNLSLKSIKNIIVYISELDEQQKIGEFFSKLDQQIELEEQKLEKLEEQKKGYMQKIFSQELRFKDKHGNSYPNWKELNFFDVLDKIIDFRGRTPKKLNMDWSNAGYLALSAVNVKKGYIDYNVEAKYGGKELYKKWMKGNELQKGQVLFTTEAPMGNVAQVPDNKGYILSQRTIAFNTNEKITNDFLASLLSSKKVYNKLLRLSSGATAKGVSQKTLKSLYVTIPISIEEQQKIGDFFRKIDELIEKQNQKIDGLKERKKGFLQKMFV